MAGHHFGIGQMAERVHLGQDELLAVVEIRQIALPLVLGTQRHGESTVVASSAHCLHDLMNVRTAFHELVRFFQRQTYFGV